MLSNFLFAFSHRHLFLLLLLLCYYANVTYYCMSSIFFCLFFPVAVFNGEIRLVLFDRGCHPHPPSLPPCPRSVSLTFYPHAGLLLLCPIRLSSSLAPVISHVPILSVPVQPLCALSSLSLRHLIDNSGAALWPLQKKVNYMLGISVLNSDDLLETLLF